MQNTCCMILHVGCYNISKERQNYRATSLTSQLHQKLCQVSEGNHWYWLNNKLYLCTVSPPSAPPPSFGPCHFQSIDGVAPQTKTKSKKQQNDICQTVSNTLWNRLKGVLRSNVKERRQQDFRQPIVPAARNTLSIQVYANISKKLRTSQIQSLLNHLAVQS